MSKITENLKSEALQTCAAKGHRMTGMRKEFWQDVVFSCSCMDCGHSVRVVTVPMPGQSKISGLAIKVPCKTLTPA